MLIFNVEHVRYWFREQDGADRRADPGARDHSQRRDRRPERATGQTAASDNDDGMNQQQRPWVDEGKGW